MLLKELLKISEAAVMDTYTQVITDHYEPVERALRRYKGDTNIVLWTWHIGLPLGRIRGKLTVINFDNTIDEIKEFFEDNNLKIIDIYKVDGKYKRIFN